MSARADARQDVTPEGGYAAAAVGGVTWVGLQYVLGRGLLLASFIFIARQISPEEFGLYAVALVFITYAASIVDLGVSQALVFLGADQRRADAALAAIVLIGAVIAGASALGASAIAGFFGRADATPMIRYLSLFLFISILSVVPDAILRARLRFRRRFVAHFSGAATQAGVTVAFGLAGSGPWALVWGQLAGLTVSGILCWALAGYRPSRRFWRPRGDDIRALVSYGAPLAGHTLVITLVADIDYLIVGRRLGSVALGFYAVAFRIPQMVVTNLFFIFSQVMFPIYSATRDDIARLRRGFVSAVRIQSLIGITIGAGLAVIAPVLVPAVFGEKWSTSIVPLQALALYAAFRSLAGGAADVFSATGRPRLALWSSLAQLAALVPALLVATEGGIEGVAWTQAGMALVIAMGLLAAAGRLVGLGWRGLVAAVAPALAAGAGTAAAVAAVRFLMPGPDLLVLVLAALAGAAVGLGAFAVADRGSANELRSLFRSRFPRLGGRGRAAAAASGALDESLELHPGHPTENVTL
jgi:PST family polysaccharide transporter